MSELSWDLSALPVPPCWSSVVQRFRERADADLGLMAASYAGEGPNAGEPTALPDAWRSWLSADERTCVASFGSQKRRREFIAGRAAARSLLAALLSCDPAEVSLRVADDGAVDVPETPVHLSIAHSGPHAVAVISGSRVGVDVEEIVPRDPGLERFLMAPDQRGVINDWPYAREEALVLAWTLKEAVLKARRSGFRLSPKKLHLTLAPDPKPEQGGEATVSVRHGDTWRVVYAPVLSSPDRRFWCAVAIPA